MSVELKYSGLTLSKKGFLRLLGKRVKRASGNVVRASRWGDCRDELLRILSKYGGFVVQWVDGERNLYSLDEAAALLFERVIIEGDVGFSRKVFEMPFRYIPLEEMALACEMLGLGDLKPAKLRYLETLNKVWSISKTSRFSTIRFFEVLANVGNDKD